MRIAYKPIRFGQTSRAVITVANQIIREYAAQGFDLTLRQLYYQFVARDLLPNTERSYKRLGSIISDGRLAGEIDWLAISDRTRFVRQNQHWDSPAEIVRAAVRSYKVDKWEGQLHHVEVWIEKDALVDVIARACRALDVPHFSCRGYVSSSAMWLASQRIRTYMKRGQIPVILHLGDHDPSGIDMTRDIAERLELFHCPTEVKRIALTMRQIRAQNPPPNPAKVTDSRHASYARKYGRLSWELDALEPSFIEKLVRRHILSHRDRETWDARVAIEKSGRQALESAASKLSLTE